MNRHFSPRTIVVTLLFLIVSILGCQKANVSPTDPISDQEKSAVNNWLSTQRAVAKDTIEFNEIVKSLDWSNADKTNYTEGSSLLAIPITKQLSVGRLSTVLAKRTTFTRDFLIVLLTSQETVTQGNLIYITPAGGSNSGTTSRLVADVLDESSTNFNGTFTMMTLDTEVMYELLYKNNNRFAESKIGGAPKTEKHVVGPNGFEQLGSAEKTVNGEKKRVNEEYCLDWYWVTTYEDGSQSWVYMYTQCGLCDANGIGSKGSIQKVKVNCGGGGGGGGGAIPYNLKTWRRTWYIDQIAGVGIYKTTDFVLEDETWIHGAPTGVAVSKSLSDPYNVAIQETWNEGVVSGDYTSVLLKSKVKVTFPSNPDVPQFVSGEKNWTVSQIKYGL